MKPEISEQFRINYILPNSIEVALKYTLTWGFHIEVEKLYKADDSEKNEVEKIQAKNDIDNVGSMLGIKYITDEEMKQLNLEFTFVTNITSRKLFIILDMFKME